MAIVNIAEACPRRLLDKDTQMAPVNGFDEQTVTCVRCMGWLRLFPGEGNVIVTGYCALTEAKIEDTLPTESVLFSQN